MDLPNLQGLTGTSSLQALWLGRGTPASQTASLSAMMGQDLEVLVQAVLPQGVQLQLPSGQTILAQGERPYPEGTQLRVRILPASSEGGVRLQTLEARPPSSPGILNPLLQGEAASLLMRLAQTNPPPELLPLIQLLKQFSEEPISPEPSKAQPQKPSAAQASADEAIPTDKLAAPQAKSAEILKPSASPNLPVGTLEKLPQQAAGAEPEHWEAWVRGSLKALGDPAASPKEAPFHLAQSHEGTGFFEIPLPWTPGQSLQLWVEEDPPESGSQGAEATKRVLLGFSFSRLGETRVGLAKGSFGLQARIWAEHCEILEADQERMLEELRTLGSPVDLQIRPLPEGVSSLRAMAAGPSLQAMG